MNGFFYIKLSLRLSYVLLCQSKRKVAMETRVWASAQKSQSSNGKLLNILCVYEKGSTQNICLIVLNQFYMNAENLFIHFHFIFKPKSVLTKALDFFIVEINSFLFHIYFL